MKVLSRPEAGACESKLDAGDLRLLNADRAVRNYARTTSAILKQLSDDIRQGSWIDGLDQMEIKARFL